MKYTLEVKTQLYIRYS